MIKTIIKIAIALAIINAAARAGMAALNYYQLKDATQQLVLFGAQAGTTDLHNRILDKATELRIPLQPADVVVHRQGTRTTVEASYTQPLALFPSYVYPAKLAFTVEVYSITPGRPEDLVK